MADFSIAFKLTSISEGGYADNPDDSGRMTYAGIARKFWPEWDGWVIVDNYKTISHDIAELNKKLRNDPLMTASKAKFYKQNFWDVNKLDQINDQQVANNIYDCGVNEGTGVAAKILQRSACVAVDGIVGPKTIQMVNALNPKGLFNSINAMRLAEYERLAQHPNQAQFLRSWKSRLIEYKPAANVDTLPQ